MGGGGGVRGWGEGGKMFCSFNLKQGPAYKLLNSLLLLLPSILCFNLTEA